MTSEIRMQRDELTSRFINIPGDKVNVVRTECDIQDPRTMSRQGAYQVALYTAHSHTLIHFSLQSAH